MKTIANYLAVALMCLMVYVLVPIPNAYAEMYNHKKDCFLREGCKHKVDKNCSGSLCKDPTQIE